MSSFTPSEAKSIERSLKTIAGALTDLRDLHAAKLELGVGVNTTPVVGGALPGQIPLDAACEHRIDDDCAMPFGVVPCDPCPDRQP